LERYKQTVSLKQLESLMENNEIYLTTLNGYSKILKYIEYGIKDIYRIYVDNSTHYLDCTLDHSLFVSETEFHPLKHLKSGDEILSVNKTKIISKIEFLEKMEIVDLEIDNCSHNFYCNDLLVGDINCNKY